MEIRGDQSWPLSYTIDLKEMKVLRKLKTQGEWKLNRKKRNETPALVQKDTIEGSRWDDYGQWWAHQNKGNRHAVPSGQDVASGLVEFVKAMLDELCKDRSE